MGHDASHLYRPSNVDYVEFLGTYDVTAQNWQSWKVPYSRSMLLIHASSSGGGGGGGRTGLTATARGGGGGGGSAAQAYLMVPSWLLPEVLYINVGPGGAGGIANVAGGNGQKSYVSCQQNVNAEAVILTSDAGNAGGGGAGSTTTTGTAGIAGIKNAGTNGPQQWGIGFSSTAGIIGTLGGNPTTPTAGANTAAFGSVQGMFSPGTGGGACSTGNVDTAGGTILAAANALMYPASVGGAVAGGIGFGGAMFERLRAHYGGVGGGGNSAGVGGAGTDGNVGCGGGGGGGGITGGKGGRGGPARVWIAWW